MSRLFLTLCALLLCTGVWAIASARYPFDHPAQQAQFQALLHDLRCPVCQDLRGEVYRMVLAHQSDQDIIQHLTARYGDFIVFKPPVKLLTSVLWLGPALLLLIGLGIFAMTCIRRVQHD